MVSSCFSYNYERYHFGYFWISSFLLIIFIFGLFLLLSYKGGSFWKFFCFICFFIFNLFLFMQLWERSHFYEYFLIAFVFGKLISLFSCFFSYEINFISLNVFGFVCSWCSLLTCSSSFSYENDFISLNFFDSFVSEKPIFNLFLLLQFRKTQSLFPC